MWLLLGRRILSIFLALALAMFFMVFLTNGFSLNLFGHTIIRAHGLARPLFLITILFFFKLYFDQRWIHLKSFLFSVKNIIYLIFVIIGGISVGLLLFYGNHQKKFLDLLLGYSLNTPSILLNYIIVLVMLFITIWLSFSLRFSNRKADTLIFLLQKSAITLGAGSLFLIFLPFEIYGWDTHLFFLFSIALLSTMIACKASLYLKVKSKSDEEYKHLSKIVYILIMLFVLIFSILSSLKLTVLRGNDDFLIYLQPWWNTFHGKFMSLNWYVSETGNSVNWFGEHLNLITLLFLPLYAFFRDPRLYVIIQAFSVGFSAIPLYYIAKLKTGQRWLAFCFVWAYLTSIFIQRPLLFDFHVEKFEPLFIFTAFLFLIKGNRLPYFLSVTFLMMCKEDAALYVIAFGFYALLFDKNKKIGLYSIFYGFTWFMTATFIIIPYFRDWQPHHILGQRYPQELGKNISEIFFNILIHPHKILHLLWNMQTLKVLLYLIIPLALLPLLSLPGLLIILIPSLEMFLAQSRFMKYLQLHYSLFVVPFYFLAAILSLSALINRYKIKPFLTYGLGIFFICSSTLFMLFLVPQPLVTKHYDGYYLNRSPISAHFNINYYLLNEHDRIGYRFMKENIPDDASLCTDYRFAHELHKREIIRIFPNCDDTDYIFVDWIGIPGGISIWLQRDQFRHIIEKNEFGVVAEQDGYVLLKRGAPVDDNSNLILNMFGQFEAEILRKKIDVGINGVHDLEAINKIARHASVLDSQEGVLTYGPDVKVNKGNYVAKFRIRTENAVMNQPIAMISVTAKHGRLVLSEKILYPIDFNNSEKYQEFSLEFVNSDKNELEFVVYFYDTASLWVDSVHLSKLDTTPETPKPLP